LDRSLLYPQQIVDDTDILNINRNALEGLGYSFLDAFGSPTFVSGSACIPTSPASLAVSVGPGRIYSLQNVDNTAYGSLAADTTDQIVKQGIQRGSITLNTPAPATAGQSINYLIEAAYQDVDGTNVVLPFYNAANPTVPFSGEGNNGAPLPTQRLGTLVIQAKAGIPAATGSQSTPAPDSGFVGLYTVTVANGQTTVTSSNIMVTSGAPFNSGSFQFQLGGCTTAPVGTVKWVKNGNIITAVFPGVTGTSNSNACLITPALPSNLIPLSVQTFGVPAVINDNVLTAPGGIEIDTVGNVSLLLNGSPTGFTASGTKGISSTAAVSWLIGV
jgi:hypothetical protein